MSLRYSRYISIAISSDTLKIAQVRSSGYIEKITKRPVSNAGADAALLGVLSGFNPARSGIICLIPADVVTLKTIEVPSVDKDELDSILALQAARQTPFNKEEILTGYLQLGHPKPNSTRVLLVVVKRDVVKDKIALMRRAKLETTGVQFIPEGIARFYGSLLKHKKNDAPVVVIDFAKTSATFILEEQAVLLSARSIPVGFEHLSVDAEAVGQFMNELKLSLEAYEQQGAPLKPGRFVLTSKQSCLTPIVDAISSAYGVKVEQIPYVDFLQADSKVKEALTKDFADDTALDVIASAVSAPKCQIDLVSQEIKDQRAVFLRGQETFKAGVLVILFLFFISGGMSSRVYFRDMFLKQNLIEKFAEQKIEVRNLENMAAKTRILRQHMSAREIPLEVIRELYRLVPDEMYLSNTSIDIAGTMTLQGASDSMSQVFSFVTSLEDSDFFESVKTKSTATRKERGKDVAVFEIVLGISSSGQSAVRQKSSSVQNK